MLALTATYPFALQSWRVGGGDRDTSNLYRNIILTAVFPDRNGFVWARRFSQDDISQEQAETFHEVVVRVAYSNSTPENEGYLYLLVIDTSGKKQ